MNWAHYSWIFLISAVKFLFAPPAAVAVVSYWETIIVTSSGGIVGVTLFYFLGNAIFRASDNKRKRKAEEQQKLGTYVVPKKFTRTNKFIVRMKRSFGLIGLSIVTPAIISIPIGSVIIARFYPNAKIALPVVYAFVIGWSFLLTTFGHTILGWFGYH